MAAQHVIDKRLAVYGQVDGATHLQVAGDVVSGGIGVGAVLARGARGNDRHLKPARVDRLVGLQGVARDLLVRQRGGGVGHVHLAGAHGRQGGVLLHEDHAHALDLGSLAVVGRVCLEDDLLAAVPLSEQVPAGANGRLAVVRPVGVLGHYAHHGKGVEQGVVGLGERDHQRDVIGRDGIPDHGEVCLRVL